MYYAFLVKPDFVVFLVSPGTKVTEVRTYVLSFGGDGVNNGKFLWLCPFFSITIQHRLAILITHIDHCRFVSARHVSSDHDFISMVY